MVIVIGMFCFTLALMFIGAAISGIGLFYWLCFWAFFWCGLWVLCNAFQHYARKYGYDDDMFWP